MAGRHTGRTSGSSAVKRLMVRRVDQLRRLATDVIEHLCQAMSCRHATVKWRWRSLKSAAFQPRASSASHLPRPPSRIAILGAPMISNSHHARAAVRSGCCHRVRCGYHRPAQAPASGWRTFPLGARYWAAGFVMSASSFRFRNTRRGYAALHIGGGVAAHHLR